MRTATGAYPLTPLRLALPRQAGPCRTGGTDRDGSDPPPRGLGAARGRVCFHTLAPGRPGVAPGQQSFQEGCSAPPRRRWIRCLPNSPVVTAVGHRREPLRRGPHRGPGDQTVVRDQPPTASSFQIRPPKLRRHLGGFGPSRVLPTSAPILILLRLLVGGRIALAISSRPSSW